MFQQLDIAIAFVVVMLMLSLLVTAVVQAISAFLDLRGKNLTRTLSNLFIQIDSGLAVSPSSDKALKGAKLWLTKIVNWSAHPFSKVTVSTQIADAVTKHPVLAHTFTRAKAIRKEELLAVLKDLCSDTTVGDIDLAAKGRLKEILASQVPGGIGTTDTAQTLAADLGNEFPDLKDQFNQIVSETMGSVSRLEAGIEKWFDTVMDRSSDVFTRWTRTVTIVISVLFVGILQIDSGLILRQISTNPGIRAGLEKLSDSALAQADETLKAGDRGTKALNLIADQHKGEAMESDFRTAPSLSTCAEGKDWVEEYGKLKQNDFSKLEKEFVDACQELTAGALRNSEDQISRIRDELAATNLTIVPDSVNGNAIFSDFGSWGRAYVSRSHVLGTLAMVVLLSLGAPFWYNALKQLTNLKPSITQKIENESSTS
jgi:hypothetical protein